MEMHTPLTSDPLARLLIDRFHLTPVRFALIIAIVAFGGGLLLSLITDTFLPQPGRIGFLNDWSPWLWSLVFTPVLTGYYLWSSSSIEQLFHDLQQSEAVDIQENELGVIAPYYHNPWREILSLAMAVIIGIAVFVLRPRVQGWAGSTDAVRTATSIMIIFGTYAVSMLCLTLLTNIWALRRILRGKEFHVNPLHPDRCGGLKALSIYSLKTVYLVAIFGLLIGASEYRFISQGLTQQFWFFHLGIPLYIVIAGYCFFAPLTLAHDKMQNAKKILLTDIARQFRDDYKSTHNALGEKTETLKGDVDKIQQLQILYELTDKFPVWPFDVQTIRSFLAALTSPFIPIIIGFIVNFLKSIIKL